ncbi:hypothetical protein [Nocardioides sp. 616]|uniref:hypothetical protein n=1 Tax=Nocardioides sp. 616 TaxID=2268090 RepID=UPI000CE3A210|nr:hypothetical protein [Nocardioides sp. 616]
MTRFLEPDELRQILASSSDTIAQELADLLEATDSAELIAVEPAAASTLLPTYETRLAAAEAGLGPRTEGLAPFVAALREDRTVEMFSVAMGRTVGIGLLSLDGDLVAITLIRAGG